MQSPTTIRLKNVTSIDALTDLSDRDAFEAAFEAQLQRHRSADLPLSVVLLEVDFFKQYTAACGEPAAEDCLKSIAEVVSATVRRGGHLVARFGPAALAVILLETDEPAARRMAEEIRFQADALVIPHPRTPLGRYVTVSVGTATSGAADGPSATNLLDAAGESLLHFRRNHRNRMARGHSRSAATS
jgi:diguanylate cyclase (GGDEF)-like protein